MSEDGKATDQTKEIEEVENRLSLLRSPEWKEFVDFQKERYHRKQRKVNNLVRIGKFTEAQIELALMDDCKKQTDIFTQQSTDRKKNLTKNKEQAGHA